VRLERFAERESTLPVARTNTTPLSSSTTIEVTFAATPLPLRKSDAARLSSVSVASIRSRRLSAARNRAIAPSMMPTTIATIASNSGRGPSQNDTPATRSVSRIPSSATVSSRTTASTVVR
jgi:hypothetical protein